MTPVPTIVLLILAILCGLSVIGFGVLASLLVRKSAEDQERDNAIHDLTEAVKGLVSDRTSLPKPPPPPRDRVIVEGKEPRRPDQR